jgi:ElaB/YqjD/DUF883 family membrane-anchored ribosome-binding protein
MATAEQEVEKLRSDVQQLRSDINILVQDVKDVGAQQSRFVVDRARKASESFLHEAEALRGRADQKIEQNPLMSVLVSFGIGFFIGRLLDRRR